MPQTTRAQPELLAGTFHERIWGTTQLSPWFDDCSKKIGEVWFQAEPPLPLLVKFLFTSAALSVQVHPNDAYARIHENSAGKTEMWHVLRANPGARIALGLSQKITAAQLRASSESGEIEQLLNWLEVHPGDTFLIPAGTIHAIGAGVVICEIQQTSDITYRLYDYGRARELHLERAMDVSFMDRWEPIKPPAGFLSRCPYFATQAIDINAPLTYVPDDDRFHLVIFTEGCGRIGSRPFRAGEVWHLPAGAGAFRIEPEGSARLLRAYVP
jgi:mannose-6-phosphate isomerase